MTKRKAQPKEDRRARFAQEYVKDLNGTQAALRAGYAESGAKVTASRLLTDANVRADIDARLAKAAAVAEITVERTLKEIARIAYGDPRTLFDAQGNLRPLHEISDDSAAMLASVESMEEYDGRGEERVAVGMTRKVKTWSKVKALDQCMAFLGMHKSVNPAAQGGLSLSINLSGGKRVRV